MLSNTTAEVERDIFFSGPYQSSKKARIKHIFSLVIVTEIHSVLILT